MTLPELFAAIPAWTSAEERALLERLSAEVPAGGQIVEIGCLYGGTTAVLALANPAAWVTSIDDFSWTPPGYPDVSPEHTRENLSKVGAFNVDVVKADSREACKEWKKHINLLWVDGGHSFEFVYSDLYNFGKFADVIAVHDYKNPAWASIEKAIETFMAKFPVWRITEVIGMIAVLRKVNK